MPIVDAAIVWPTDEQRTSRLAEIKRYEGYWKAARCLLIEKPYLAAIGSLVAIEHDQNHFSVVLAFDDVILAPHNFDASQPARLTCVWNQPYMSISARGVNAPYCFYLYFSRSGPERLAQFRKTKVFQALHDQALKGSDVHLFPLLRLAFTHPDRFTLRLECASKYVERHSAPENGVDHRP